MTTTQDYMGDGVYAEYDGYGVTLRANSHDNTNLIYIEPFVLDNINNFVKLPKHHNNITMSDKTGSIPGQTGCQMGSIPTQTGSIPGQTGCQTGSIQDQTGCQTGSPKKVCKNCRHWQPEENRGEERGDCLGAQNHFNNWVRPNASKSLEIVIKQFKVYGYQGSDCKRFEYSS